jgi:glycosyltransferase involved in cell wall biosynthesis
MPAIDLSVIVTTRNEEKNLPACLESVRRQTHPAERIETIVVDNASSDATKEIARRFTPLVHDRGPERSAQRNLGISLSQGRYVLYLDADMRLSDGVVGECVSEGDRSGWVGIYVPEIVVGRSWWTRVRDFERGFYTGSCIDAVRCVRRETALALGGFDESLNGPEDWDFDRRIGESGPRGVLRAPLYHDESPFDLGRYLEKKLYYSRGFAAYRRKWGENDPIIRRQFGWVYRLGGVFVEKGKWRRLLRRPDLALGMYFLRFRVGFAYFLGKG